MKTKGLYVEVYVKDKNDKKGWETAVAVALKEFKKRVKKEGILQDLRNREAYMSPSKKRRFRKNEAMKRRKREHRKTQWIEKNNEY